MEAIRLLKSAEEAVDSGRIQEVSPLSSSALTGPQVLLSCD